MSWVRDVERWSLSWGSGRVAVSEMFGCVRSSSCLCMRAVFADGPMDDATDGVVVCYVQRVVYYLHHCVRKSIRNRGSVWCKPMPQKCRYTSLLSEWCSRSFQAVQVPLNTDYWLKALGGSHEPESVDREVDAIAQISMT